MPAGRPRNPAGAGEDAPVYRLRLTAELEAALALIGRDAVPGLILARARRDHGAERVAQETAAVTRRRERAG
jgi:hypothetical protein